jgi:hypothetical protein
MGHTRRWRWMKAYFSSSRLSTRGQGRCCFSQDVALHQRAFSATRTATNTSVPRTTALIDRYPMRITRARGLLNPAAGIG